MPDYRINDDYWKRQLLLQQSEGSGLVATSPVRDTFGRFRVSSPYTVFDSKMLGDNRALFWDEAETSGAGTSGAYDANSATYTLSVSDATAGTRVRQTFQRFNYQPGKSQLVNMTFVMGAAATGITRRVGYFGTNDGLFLQQDSSGLAFVIRSSASGSPVDTVYRQAEWNIDTISELDATKAQILYLDFESLQVGSVRFGFVINAQIRYAHVAHHANLIDTVYFKTPNCPLRYEVSNDGTGPAATLKHICTTVISEGGQEVTGITRATTTAGTHLSATSADLLYAVLGLRLKATHLDNIVRVSRISVISESNDDFEWQLILNPTVDGTFAFSDIANSAMQEAKGATANTVTGGTLLDAGFGKTGAATTEVSNTIRSLGATIGGTSDRLVLALRSLTPAGVFQATITWQEFA